VWARAMARTIRTSLDGANRSGARVAERPMPILLLERIVRSRRQEVV
jgi:hypothetical protein